MIKKRVDEFHKKFQESTLSGYRAPLKNTDNAPACFCCKNTVCEEHTKLEPNMETMMELLEGQIMDIQNDETRLEQSLDFVAQALDGVILSRKDTFKEQITRLY